MRILILSILILNSCKLIDINSTKPRILSESGIKLLEHKNGLRIVGAPDSAMIAICEKTHTGTPCKHMTPAKESNYILGLEEQKTYLVKVLDCEALGETLACDKLIYQGTYYQRESLSDLGFRLMQESLQYDQTLLRSAMSYQYSLNTLSRAINLCKINYSADGKSSYIDSIDSILKEKTNGHILSSLIKIKQELKASHGSAEDIFADYMSNEKNLQLIAKDKYVVELLNFVKRSPTKTEKFRAENPWYSRLGHELHDWYQGGYWGHSAIHIKVLNPTTNRYETLRYFSAPLHEDYLKDENFYDDWGRVKTILPPVSEKRMNLFLKSLENSNYKSYNLDFMFHGARAIRNGIIEHLRYNNINLDIKSKSFQKFLKSMTKFEITIREAFDIELPIRYFGYNSDKWTVLTFKAVIDYIFESITADDLKNQILSQVSDFSNKKEEFRSSFIDKINRVTEEINTKRSQYQAEYRAAFGDSRAPEIAKLIEIQSELTFRKSKPHPEVENFLNRALTHRLRELRTRLGLDYEYDLREKAYRHGDLTQKNSAAQIFIDFHGFSLEPENTKLWKDFLTRNYPYVKEFLSDPSLEDFIKKYENLGKNCNQGSSCGFHKYLEDLELNETLSAFHTYYSRFVELRTPAAKWSIFRNCACSAGALLNKLYDTRYFSTLKFPPLAPNQLQKQADRYALAYERSLRKKNQNDLTSRGMLRIGAIGALLGTSVYTYNHINDQKKTNTSYKLNREIETISNVTKLQECFEVAREGAYEEITSIREELHQRARIIELLHHLYGKV